jgi:hypothetical protein
LIVSSNIAYEDTLEFVSDVSPRIDRRIRFGLDALGPGSGRQDLGFRH